MKINVLVQYDGAIMESYPVQGTASVVSIKKITNNRLQIQF